MLINLILQYHIRKSTISPAAKKMTKKRKSQTACDAPSKRQRGTLEHLDDSESVSFQDKFGSDQPRVDPKYGQRGAFPGLDDGDDDGLFYGPANDGLEYLRMVR